MVRATLLLVLVVSIPAMYARVPRVNDTANANLTFFDDETSATGVKFGAYPISWDSHDVYPIAVHHDNFDTHAYDIFEIIVWDSQYTLKVLYGHVVDLCDREDDVCNTNVKKHGYDFLIDLHKLGWKAAGVSDGIVRTKFSVVGNVFIDKLPTDALDETVLCECKNEYCDLSEALWCPRGRCALKNKCWD